VLDQGLVVSIPWSNGLKPKGVAVLNWPDNLEQLDLFEDLSLVGTVDATTVSTKAFGERAFPITNTTMLGALAKTTSWVKLDSLTRAVKTKWTGNIAESNIIAIEEAYKATKVHEI
jgi:Pyruvate/2-oxoacid:ferredoxin oxidoreductase gamma subunit